MLIEHRGRRPTVAETAYIAPNAVLSGDVRIGEHVRILFGAVLTAEGGRIEIGDYSIVMENAVLRGREGHDLVLGRHVLAGPHSHLNGATIEDDVFIGTGASVFPGATIATGAEIRIGAVVHVNTHVPPNATVPIGWIALGNPAQIFPPDAHERYEEKLRALDFPNTVFGITRDKLTMEAITHHYAGLFGAHKDDQQLG